MASPHGPLTAGSPHSRADPRGRVPRLPTLVPEIMVLGSWPPGTRPAGLRATRQEDVISMRALVVYESMFGNTHLIADNIADGLRSDFEVTLAPAAEATWDLVAAPTCWWPARRPTCTGCPAG